MIEPITTKQAVELSGRDVSLIRRHAAKGSFKAQKFANVWMIEKESFLSWMNSPRPAGRPSNKNCVRLMHKE